jgi:2-polyprenyl-3-methyl-5-hydroxy-6-metoxy-1,4-benzoquinol methylase
MHWQPLAERNRQPEWMDQAGLDGAAHDQALQGLRRINAISGAVGCLFTPVQALAADLNPSRSLRILDVACGGGDNTIALAERCRRNGLAVQVDGCDRSEQAVAIASRHAAGTPLGTTFFQADVLVDPLPAGYDVMVCSLFLHHLEEADAVELLRRMGQSCRHLVLVNDLIRSSPGYGLAWVGCRLLSRSPIVHFDGPVSVQGAFRMDEALDLATRAGLGGARIRRHWPDRFLLSWHRPDLALEAP